MKRCTVFAFTFCALLTGASAQEPPVAFKGVALGASVEEYKQGLPDHRCRPDKCDFSLRLECVPRPDFEDCLKRNSFGGARVELVTSTFRDGKLAHMLLIMSSFAATDVQGALREKLGEPTRVSTEPFRTRGGASADNADLTWERGPYVVRARQHSARLGEGTVVITTQTELKAQEGDKKDQAKKGAGDL